MRAARTIAIAAVTGAFLLPLAWTGLAAVGVLPDDSMRPPSWTGPPTLDHIADIGVAEPTFWQELATSTVTAIVAACLTVAVAFPAAFALARSRYRARRAVTQGFLVLASLPVMAYAFPLADLSRRVHLIDTFAGIAPASVPGFVVAQGLGLLVGMGAIVVLYPRAGLAADDVVVPATSTSDSYHEGNASRV